MKKTLLKTLMALLCGTGAAQAQCIGTTPYGSATINSCSTSSTQITACNWKGDYSELTFNITGVFIFDATSATSAVSTLLTLTDANDNPIVFGAPPLQATITTTGDYRLHITDNSCGTEEECNETSYRCASPACSGAPTAGTVSNSSYTICPGSSASFFVTGSTSGASGIINQWQESTSPGGPFTDVATGGNAIAFTTPTLSTTMYYQMVTTCSVSAQSATTSVIAVYPTLPSALCYCTFDLGGGNCGGDHISNVRITSTGFNNNSTCNDTPNGTYTQYLPGATTTATLTTGSSYSFAVTTEDDNIESLWIDYDHSGTFDAGEHTQICTTSTPGSATGINVLIPVTAQPGLTGMRIRSRATGNNNGAGDACENFGSGETEDYFVTIATGANCTGTPNAGTVPSSFGVCPNNTLAITSSSVSTGMGITYQWQESTSVSGPFTNVTAGTGGTTFAYTTGTLTAPVYYQMVVTCTASAMSATTAVTSVSINPASQCYCVPSYSNGCDNDQLDTVVVGSLANYTSGCPSAPYYTHFSALPVPNYGVGTNVPAKFACGSGGNHYVNVWIDLDDDGSFTSAERLLTNFNVASAVVPAQSTVVAIPAAAPLGNHRMRVINYWSSTAISDPNACGPFSYGETEDFTVNIDLSTGLNHSQLTENALMIFPNPANDVVNIYAEKTIASTKVFIYNTIGELVSEAQLMDNHSTINTSVFAPGIYTVKLVSGGNTISKKLVIYK